MSIKHSLATYPGSVLGYVVSDTKICLQFEKVLGKLRFKEGADYVKLPNCSKALCITPAGTDVDILAVGCQMPVIEELQQSLVKAYLQYGIDKSQVYTKVYGKSFLQFLVTTRRELDNVITEIIANETSNPVGGLHCCQTRTNPCGCGSTQGACRST